MKLTKKGIVFIALLIVCALVMTFEFGGNYGTFYEWLFDGEGFGLSGMPDDSLYSVLAWIYLVALIGTVVFEIVEKYDFRKLCSYISFGTMAVILLSGLYATTLTSHNRGSLCIGMPLLFLLSAAFLVLGKKWDPAE